MPRSRDWFSVHAMGLEGSVTTIVLGFREEAWPKGHGYLYWRMGAGSREIMLRHCDLYDINYVTVASMFEAALAEVMRKLAITPREVNTLSVATENMSTLAQNMLRNAIKRMTETSGQAS